MVIWSTFSASSRLAIAHASVVAAVDGVGIDAFAGSVEGGDDVETGVRGAKHQFVGEIDHFRTGRGPQGVGDEAGEITGTGPALQVLRRGRDRSRP